MRRTINSSLKSSSFYFQVPWIWTFQQANKRITRVSFSFVLAEFYGKNEKITSQCSHTFFFFSKSGTEKVKSMEWVRHKLHWSGISYTMPVKTGLDFSSYKPLKICCLAGPWGFGSAVLSAQWAGELAGRVAVPQHMGHQVIGDTVPAAGAFSIRMWCQKFPFHIGIFGLTNWTLALIKAPQMWATGQIPHQNKELVPAGARLALSLWQGFRSSFFLPHQ